MQTIGELEQEILCLLTSCLPQGAARIDLAKYEPRCSARHELMFMLKPELTAAGPESLYLILAQLRSAFRKYGLEVSLASVFSGLYLDETGFMNRHYLEVSRGSILGRKSLPNSAVLRFRDVYGFEISETTVLGGAEVLEKYQCLDALSLAALCDATSTTRLAGGTYCNRIELDGQRIFVINGFYPLQVLRFTRIEARSVVMVLHTNWSWRELRHDMLGVTDPKLAKEDSIRSWLKDNESALGIEPVSSMRNGFHLSASPIEAAREIAGIIEDTSTGSRITASDTGMGLRLQELGVSRELLEMLVSNPYITAEGQAVPVFDLIEDMDVEDCAAMVMASRLGTYTVRTPPGYNSGELMTRRRGLY